MIDVATYVRRKCLASALYQIPFGLFCLAVALVLMPMFVYDEVQNHQGSWAIMLIGIMPFLIGALTFTEGVRRLRAGMAKDYWLKAGAEGISYRLPGKARRQSFYLNYVLAERTIPWGEVVKMYPHVFKVNGIPMSRKLVLVTKQGKVELEGVYFKESPARILDAMIEAAKGR